MNKTKIRKLRSYSTSANPSKGGVKKRNPRDKNSTCCFLTYKEAVFDGTCLTIKLNKQ